ncbi:MAG: potassium channel family protein [Verrucomicrobiota bacterium]
MKPFLHRNRSFPLLLCLLGIILTSTLRGTDHPLAYMISGSVVSLLVAGAASLLDPGRLWFRIFLSLGLLILASLIGQYLLTGRILFGTLLHAKIIALHLLTLGLLLRHAFFQAGAPPFDRLCSAVAGYLLLALFWGNLYEIILIQQPEAIVELATGEPLAEEHVVYYSLVTLTTQGYGDIVPRSSAARLTAALEGTTGTLYLAALIAFLIGMVKPEEQTGGS